MFSTEISLCLCFFLSFFRLLSFSLLSSFHSRLMRVNVVCARLRIDSRLKKDWITRLGFLYCVHTASRHFLPLNMCECVHNMRGSLCCWTKFIFFSSYSCWVNLWMHSGKCVCVCVFRILIVCFIFFKVRSLFENVLEIALNIFLVAVALK